MGNKQNQPGIKIVLEKPSIYAGESISGTVNLVLPQSTNGLVILFLLKGKETTRFRLKSRSDEFSGKILILNFTQVLFNSFGQFIQAGNYVIPFTIATPASIPGTFDLASRSYRGKISYSVKASIMDQKQQRIATDKLLVLVKQAINARRISIIGSSGAPISICGCFTRGQCILSAHLDKNAYLPGENIITSINIDNSKCAAQVRKVLVKLVRIVKLTGNNRQYRVFRQEICKKKVKVMVRPGQSLLNEGGIEVVLALKKGFEYFGLCGSTSGRMIECSYQVEISSFCGVFYSNGPSLDVIVMIFPSEILQAEASAPEHWDPVELGNAVMESCEVNPYGYNG